ncbi:MAG: PAS domain-containing sensor histidine kinase [Candidatus Hodarchaeales archaeon]|jgi:PAS domain S-box-containing protein
MNSQTPNNGLEEENQKEKIIQNLVDNLKIGVYRNTGYPEGRFVQVNPAMVKIFGYDSAEELMQIPILKLYMDPKDREPFLHDVKKEGFVKNKEVQLLKKDGSSFWASVTTQIQFGKNGEIKWLDGVLEDITEQKELEWKLRLEQEELQASEEKYRSFVQNFQGIAFRGDMKYVPIFFHGAVEEITGYTEDEFINGNPRWDQIIHPEDVNEVYKHLDDMRSLPDNLIEIEHRIIRKDGQIRWVYENCQNVCDFSGRPVYVQGTIIDISNRKVAEKALREREENYRTLFEESPISLWEEDFSEIKKFFNQLHKSGVTNFRDHFEDHPEDILKCASMIKIVNVNQATLDMYKVKDKSELLNNLDKIFIKDSLDTFKEEIITLAEGKTEFKQETVNGTPEGDIININIAVSVPKGYEETLSRIIVSIMDITSLKRAEESIRTNEVKFRALFQNASDILLLHRIEKDHSLGRFLEVNDVTCQKLEYSRNELMLMTPQNIADPEMFKKGEDRRKELIEKTFQTFEMILISKSNKKIPVEINSHVFALNKETVVLSVARDISERKQAEEILKKQKEETELYLGILTHDLRNYQTAAKGFVDLALMESLPSERERFLTQTRTNIVRTNTLINNISVLMRENITWTFQLEPIHLKPVLNNVKIILNDLFPQKIIDFNTNIIDPESSILADSLFEQSLLNIFTNAVKSDPEELVKIDIELVKKNNFCILKITDNGKGIPPEQREGIFERFKVYRKTGKGSGLGLYIVKMLIDRYNGEIWIENRVPGDYTKGTRICLKLKCKK